MLFMVKFVRAVNDNVASVFYNAFKEGGGLVTYFWLGFGISVFSLICCFVIMQIHEKIVGEEKLIKNEILDEESKSNQELPV